MSTLLNSGRALLAATWPVLLVSVTFAAWCVWLYAPAMSWGPLSFLGQNPDAIDAAYGMTLVGHAERLGPWTSWINYPHGALALFPPYLTGQVMAPLVSLLSPGPGYTLTVALVMALDAVAVTLLCREVSGRWDISAVGAAVFLCQPVILQLAVEGTLEHLAIWPLPAALAAALAALRTGDQRFAAAAGLLFALIPLDFPYGVAYLAPLLPVALAAPLWTRWRQVPRGRNQVKRLLKTALGVGLPVLALIALAFMAADLGTLQNEAQGLDSGNNALRIREIYDSADIAPGPAGSRARSGPTGALMAAGLALGLVGGRRGLGWLVAGGLCLALAIGDSADNAAYAVERWGSGAGVAFEGIGAFNAASFQIFPFSYVRFPWRWGSMAALGLVVAISAGAGRLLDWVPGSRRFTPARLVLGLALGLWLATVSQQWQRYRPELPEVSGPELSFCQWIKDQPGDGAVLLAPTFRQPVDDGMGVFGRLGVELSGRDRAWIQLLHGRPQNIFVETVPTLLPTGAPEGDLKLVIGYLDLLAESSLRDRVAEPSLPEGGDAAALSDALVGAGYRFVVLDEAAFDERHRGLAATLLDANVVGVERFEDGRGITVLELR